MRVKWTSYNPNIVGLEGTIIGHTNNSVQVRLTTGEICDDLYWNIVPLDDEAQEYIKEVKRTATPMLTPLNND